jgi:hypothetical protein
MIAIKKVREFYNEALAYSIEKRRDVLAFDLIKFSQLMNFHLIINKAGMTMLVKNKLYAVIE